MAKWVFMTDPVTGNIGLFDEPVPGSSPADYENPNSACNAPLNNPADELAYLYWHITMDNMEVSSDDVVSVAHAGIAAVSTGGTGVGIAGQYDYSYAPVDYVLKTHGLGYAPMAYVAVGDDVVTPGYIVQINTSGAARFVSVYVTTTQVVLREWAQKGGTALAGYSQDYRVVVIKQQPAAEGNDPPRLIDWDPVTGQLKMGDSRFASSRRYLQVVPGGSPFGLCLGRTIDLNNGAVRFVAPDGTTYDPVPATTKLRIVPPYGSTSFGSSMAYGGSFSGDTVIQVQAP